MTQKNKTSTTTYKGQVVETIDCTPTWSAMLPLMLSIHKQGNDEGVETILIEFRRMAEAADKWNDYVKQSKTKNENENA